MKVRFAAGLMLMFAVLPALAAGCGLPGAESRERSVLVDYHFDQFAAVFPAFFPKQVTVRQGDTLVFKQSWSGEPHSINAGGLVDEPFRLFWPILKSGPPFPTEPPTTGELGAAVKKAEKLPHMYSNGPSGFAQNGAQPCYLDTGTPSSDEDKPCPQRPKPAFSGNQAYYASGLIPYEGEQGNIFRLPVAADAKPGTHFYYCNLHGPLMSGAFTIVAKDAGIPSQAEVNAQAQKEIARYTDPASKVFRNAQAGKSRVKGNLAGVEVDPAVTTAVTEFVPRTIKTGRGQKVTWRIVGDAHTVSFNVPKYLPEVVIGKDGVVRYNNQVTNPVGGPGFPPPGGGPSGPQSGPPPPVNTDAGSYDGSRFFSSGLGGPSFGPGPPQEVTYSVTFTRAGTYKYACLVHPQMVGEVQVQ